MKRRDNRDNIITECREKYDHVPYMWLIKTTFKQLQFTQKRTLQIHQDKQAISMFPWYNKPQGFFAVDKTSWFGSRLKLYDSGFHYNDGIYLSMENLIINFVSVSCRDCTSMDISFSDVKRSFSACPVGDTSDEKGNSCRVSSSLIMYLNEC